MPIERHNPTALERLHCLALSRQESSMQIMDKPIIPSSLWPQRITLGVIGLLVVNATLASWGFIQSFVLNYAVGKAYGNNYTGVWINGFTWVLTIQALAVMIHPPLTLSRPARFYAWCWYSAWMFACAIILLIGMHYRELTDQYAWAFLWLPPIGVMAAAVSAHRTNSRKTQPMFARVDVEANPQAPKACSNAAWRKCWFNFWAFCGWSSMFWLSFLGFFLALQAAWLVSDQCVHPAPGKLYQIDLEDGTGYRPNIHLACKGPTDTGFSTFILEAGGGSPGVVYAGIVDELAAAGRRACWYDRLGYGWSDDTFLYGAADQSIVVLYNTLKAAGETGPYIIAGHSVGGQLALMFAGYHPDNVTGIAMLDSYDSAAIALGWTGSCMVNATTPNGRKVTRPALNYMTAVRSSLADVVRAITPLGWARFISISRGSYPYNGEVTATYGNNNNWQSQWIALRTAVYGVTDSSDMLSDLAYNMSGGRVENLWHGTSWPVISPKPVLLLPAEKTLEQGIPGGCNVYELPTDSVCQRKVADCKDMKCVYPNLYVRYLQTISSNISMIVMPGTHGYPKDSYKETAAALLDKFTGV